MLVFSGVFERHPELQGRRASRPMPAGRRTSCYRMDHAYKRHRYWMKGKELPRLPSEYFRDNISLTFQDDWTAFQFADRMGPQAADVGQRLPAQRSRPGRGART